MQTRSTNGLPGYLKALGPGILFAGAAIGGSHLVWSTRAGAEYGFNLLWIVLLVNLFKYPFFEFACRYTAATGETMLTGYRRAGSWVLWSFFVIALVSAVLNIAALTLTTAVLAQGLAGGALTPLWWSIVTVAVCLGILVVGRYALLDSVMKVIVLVLAVSTVAACAMAAAMNDGLELGLAGVSIRLRPAVPVGHGRRGGGLGRSQAGRFSMILKLGRAALRAGSVECGRLFRPKTLSAPGDGVAVVRPDLLGDFVLASGFLPLFRAIWPDRPLALAGNAAWGDLALWLDRHRIVSEEPLFDAFIPLRPETLGWRAPAKRAPARGAPTGAGYAWALEALGRRAPARGAPTYARALEALAPWGTLVYFVSSRAHAIDRLLGDAPGAVIACEGDNANQPAFLNRRNLRRYDTVLPGCGQGSELARNACFINTLAGRELAEPDPPRWHIPDDLRRQTVAELARRTGWPDPDRPFVCLSPYASSTLKEWPAAFWKALAGELRRLRPDLTLVVLGAPRDRNRPVPDGCVNLVGATSLPELACVLAGACVSVSGDTAAAHLAAAVGTSTVAVVGGGHRDRFFPYPAAHAGCVNRALRLDLPCDGCGWACRYRPFGRRPAPCLERISVERVLGEALELVS